MIRYTLTCVLLAGVVLVSGCTGSSPEADEAGSQALSSLEKRVTEMEQIISGLTAELERLRVQNAGMQRSFEAMAKRGGAPADGDVAELVEAAVAEELKAREELQQQQEAQQRDERRQQAEQRRQQAEERRREATQQRIDEMSEVLALDEGQQEQLKEIATQAQGTIRDVFQKMRSDGSFDRDAMTAAIDAVIQDSETAMKEILSEEQFAKYQEEQEPIRQIWEGLRNMNFGQGRRGGTGNAGR